MDAELATQVHWIRNRILWKSESCWLLLEGGLVVLTSQDHRLIFRAPLAEVRASFPKMLFPFLYASMFAILTVRGQTYRLSFAPSMRYLGWKATSDPLGGTSFGPSSAVSDKDVQQAKYDVQAWRAALERPPNGAIGPPTIDA